MISKARKQEIMKQYARSEGDTGSVEVQVAVLTEEINILTAHMKDHPKDFHSNRGLMKKIGRRRNLMSYLKDNDLDRYHALVKALGLRK